MKYQKNSKKYKQNMGIHIHFQNKYVVLICYEYYNNNKLI